MKETILRGPHQAVSQILPFKYPWAWDLYLKSNNNHWVPSEIPMDRDVRQWKDPNSLTDDERLLVKRILGFFAGTESLVANNLLLVFMGKIRSGECKQYICRQNFEEAIHNHSLVYMCDSLNLDVQEMYEAYADIPGVREKDDFLIRITRWMERDDFDINTFEGVRDLLLNAVAYWLIAEGTFFFNCFAALLSFKRRNLMPATTEMIEYTYRDEENHTLFGTMLINTIIQEHPEVWTSEVQGQVYDLFREALELELNFSQHAVPRGILGMNQDLLQKNAEFLANKRLASIGLEAIFENKDNPFPWLFETVSAQKMKNFFESRPTDYQQSNVEDDF